MPDSDSDDKVVQAKGDSVAGYNVFEQGDLQSALQGLGTGT